jgi:hypothetical protein
MVKKFTILGERCSGTNYLEELISNNFNIEITWEYGWKHFFGFYDFKQTNEENETLFIGIVRNPIEWLDSFFSEQHHIPNRPKPVNNFLLDEFYSVDNNKNIIKEDLNYLTKKKYKNIFELRFLKNYYLLRVMPTKVKNFILINYENLRDNTENVLDMIMTKFNLEKKSPVYKNISYYKKEKKSKYVKKSLKLSKITQLLCVKLLNLRQEQALGYVLTRN